MTKYIKTGLTSGSDGKEIAVVECPVCKMRTIFAKEGDECELCLKNNKNKCHNSWCKNILTEDDGLYCPHCEDLMYEAQMDNRDNDYFESEEFQEYAKEHSI